MHIVSWKTESRIDHNDVDALLDDGHVLAYLPAATQRDHLNLVHRLTV